MTTRRETRELEFRGERGARGPSTWGQRHIWTTLQVTRPHDTRFNLALSAQVPEGRSLDDVLAALRLLVERHESLRTTFDERDGYPPAQTVASRGRMTVSVEHLDGPGEQDPAARVWSEAASHHFDIASHWPVRFLVFVYQGRPLQVGAALSHMAVDILGGDLLKRDLEDLLSGAAGKPGSTARAHQPLDEAAHEQSDAGREALTRTLGLWRSAIEGAPPLFPSATRPYSGARYPSGTLYAKGLGRRVKQAADRLKVRSSAFFMAATAAALTRHAGADSCALTITCANRTSARTLDYVGTIAQQGLLVLDSLGPSLHDTVRRTWPALLRAHQYSRYDQGALDRLGAELAGRRDLDFEQTQHYVNFSEETTPIRGPEGFPDLADGEVVYQEGTPVTGTPLKFGMRLGTDGDDAYIRVFADRHYLDGKAVRGILDETNRLLQSGAAGDVSYS
ncbi:condensation domain-containing protein [Streptomyces sp. NPDC005402]|uniref:condensation domain-containing protein n=1 Tax=Streptomyces sp. NPDC005402 TaxID=3155338 RepID=UPI0033A2EEEE